MQMINACKYFSTTTGYCTKKNKGFDAIMKEIRAFYEIVEKADDNDEEIPEFHCKQNHGIPCFGVLADENE